MSRDLSGWLCLYKLLYAVYGQMDATFSAFLSKLSQNNIVWGYKIWFGKSDHTKLKIKGEVYDKERENDVCCIQKKQ